MLTITTAPLPGGAAVAYVYRPGASEWCVASHGDTRHQAISRAKSNFDPGESFRVISGSPGVPAQAPRSVSLNPKR